MFYKEQYINEAQVQTVEKSYGHLDSYDQWSKTYEQDPRCMVCFVYTHAIGGQEYITLLDTIESLHKYFPSFMLLTLDFDKLPILVNMNHVIHAHERSATSRWGAGTTLALTNGIRKDVRESMLNIYGGGYKK